MIFNRFIAKILLRMGRTPRFSSAIDGSLTAGYGRLDEFGFWQYPLKKNEIEALMHNWRKRNHE
jgi:hypothetical protein